MRDAPNGQFVRGEARCQARDSVRRQREWSSGQFGREPNPRRRRRRKRPSGQFRRSPGRLDVPMEPHRFTAHEVGQMANWPLDHFPPGTRGWDPRRALLWWAETPPRASRSQDRPSGQFGSPPTVAVHGLDDITPRRQPVIGHLATVVVTPTKRGANGAPPYNADCVAATTAGVLNRPCSQAFAATDAQPGECAHV